MSRRVIPVVYVQSITFLLLARDSRWYIRSGLKSMSPGTAHLGNSSHLNVAVTVSKLDS
jgi:hypothetical protein